MIFFANKYHNKSLRNPKYSFKYLARLFSENIRLSCWFPGGIKGDGALELNNSLLSQTSFSNVWVRSEMNYFESFKSQKSIAQNITILKVRRIMSVIRHKHLYPRINSTIIVSFKNRISLLPCLKCHTRVISLCIRVVVVVWIRLLQMYECGMVCRRSGLLNHTVKNHQ